MTTLKFKEECAGLWSATTIDPYRIYTIQVTSLGTFIGKVATKEGDPIPAYVGRTTFEEVAVELQSYYDKMHPAPKVDVMQELAFQVYARIRKKHLEERVTFTPDLCKEVLIAFRKYIFEDKV